MSGAADSGGSAAADAAALVQQLLAATQAWSRWSRGQRRWGLRHIAPWHMALWHMACRHMALWHMALWHVAHGTNLALWHMALRHMAHGVWHTELWHWTLSNSGDKAGKRGKGEAFATGGLSPDVAESLNKARKFLEGAGAGSRASGAAAEAVAVLPAQLQDLVRRALSADKVSSKGERRECRKSLPAVVERMRDGLVRDVRRALESHMTSDMSGRSELPVKEADALAQTIRRLDLSVRSAVAAHSCLEYNRLSLAQSAKSSLRPKRSAHGLDYVGPGAHGSVEN